MQLTYVFPVTSEIKVEDGNWSSLSFERDGKRVSIQKPYPKAQLDWDYDSLTMHSRTPPPKAWFEFEAGRQDEFGISLITVEVILPADATEESLQKEMRGFLLPLLQQLISWIRVLTGQFWLGYYGRSSRGQKYVMYIGHGEKDKARHSGSVGWGLEYGRDLDGTTWAQIGTKLALGERPRPSQLFFCDALLDIEEGDLAQAIVALGVSSEIEISILRQEILAQKDEEFGRLFDEYMKPRFEESLKLLKEFGCDPFSDFDAEADRLVRNLYKARGRAAHLAECYYLEDRKKVFITWAEVPQYVAAVEKLFAWSDAQRIRVCGGGK
jgi:hypothetical protein